MAATAARPVKLPNFVRHPSLEEPTALKQYGGQPESDPGEYEERHMPDEATRDHARRMHYAAHRAASARGAAEANRWLRRYYQLRDSIVLGNRKLVFRAVRQRLNLQHRADDLIGDCHIVLIQAVAAYNPWMGIRFSTYAYTCLVRALSRLSQRMAGDWLARSMPLDSIPDGGPDRRDAEDEARHPNFPRLDEYLRADHPLLSSREKAIITMRFNLTEQPGSHTLEKVGRELGLSKERVRQVQATALGKLRKALVEGA